MDTGNAPRAQYFAISFRRDDVIILEFDWTFLVRGTEHTSNFELVRQTVFSRVRITGWARD